jgi:hypothetical protein
MNIGLNSQIPSKAFVITPNDTTRISVAGLFCSGAGTLVVEPEGNVAAGLAVPVTITMPAGGYLVLRCVRVLVASTATGIMGLA